MSTLILKEFRCIEATEGDGDSPYFVVFYGTGTAPGEAKIKLIRREEWDDTGIDSGQLVRNVNATVGTVEPGFLVLVALFDEDDGPDLTGDTLLGVRDWMRTLFKAYAASGTSSAAMVAQKLLPEFRKAIEAFRTNDDLIQARYLPIPDRFGNLPLSYFNGYGGRYRVRFKLA